MDFITWFVKTNRTDIIENWFPVAGMYFFFAVIFSLLANSWILFGIAYTIGFAICAPIAYVLLKEQWDKVYNRYEKTRKE